MDLKERIKKSWWHIEAVLTHASLVQVPLEAVADIYAIGFREGWNQALENEGILKEDYEIAFKKDNPNQYFFLHPFALCPKTMLEEFEVVTVRADGIEDALLEGRKKLEIL